MPSATWSDMQQSSYLDYASSWRRDLFKGIYMRRAGRRVDCYHELRAIGEITRLVTAPKSIHPSLMKILISSRG